MVCTRTVRSDFVVADLRGYSSVRGVCAGAPCSYTTINQYQQWIFKLPLQNLTRITNQLNHFYLDTVEISHAYLQCSMQKSKRASWPSISWRNVYHPPPISQSFQLKSPLKSTTNLVLFYKSSNLGLISVLGLSPSCPSNAILLKGSSAVCPVLRPGFSLLPLCALDPHFD